MKFVSVRCRRARICVSTFLTAASLVAGFNGAAKASSEGPISFAKSTDPATSGKAELQRVLQSHTLYSLADNLTNRSCGYVSQDLSVAIGKSLGMFQGSTPAKTDSALLKEFRIKFAHVMKSNLSGDPQPNDPIVIAHPRKFLQDLGDLVVQMHKAHFLAPNQINDDQTDSWPPASSYKFVSLDRTTVELAPINPKLQPMIVHVEDGYWRLDLPVRSERVPTASAK